MALVLGVDSSTQSCKVVVVDAEPGGLAGGVHPEAHALDPSAHAHDASDPLLVLLRAHSLSPPVSAAAAPAAASTSSLHCQSTISGASSPCS